MFCSCCRKLKRLNLGGNVLTSVPQKALSILDMLKKLEMQENRISEIREGDFEGKLFNFRSLSCDSIGEAILFIFLDSKLLTFSIMYLTLPIHLYKNTLSK